MRSLSNVADELISIEARNISHPLTDAARACRLALAKSVINLRTGIQWFSRNKASGFLKIKVQRDGDLVRAQSGFADRTAISQHELMMMAAMLAAHLKPFKVKGKPMLVPCSGEVITNEYYQQANSLLQSNIVKLQHAFRHYYDKLLALQSKSDAKHQKKNIARCANQLKQVQQILVGALFLQQQYQHLQLDEVGCRAITAHSLALSENAMQLIAQENYAAGLNPFDDNVALQQAVIDGEMKQVRILLANPNVQVNQRDERGYSPLYLAAEHNRLSAVKLLIAQGALYRRATATADSALTVALLRGHKKIAEFLLTLAAVESRKLKHNALHQGPVKKNAALRHVEYIFHCLLGVDFISYLSEGDYYANRTDGAGIPFQFRLEKKTPNNAIAYCPNGQAYNLSMALKHANLCYFLLTDTAHDLNLIKQCEKMLGVKIEGKVANKLTSKIGGDLVVYAAEQAAITNYTGSGHSDYNELLRGKLAAWRDMDSVKQSFIRAMLAISGANKNLHPQSAIERPSLFRNEHTLPTAMLMQMKTANQIVKRAGLLSFSENGSYGCNRQHQWRLDSSLHWQGSVANISWISSEKEVLFSPACIRFTEFEPNAATGRITFTTEIVRGVATEFQDNYFITLAMNVASEILKQPYKEAPNPRFGIARHNHALAHHIRASVFIEPVIDYFKQFAADPKFREFCDTLQPEEVIMMKVMMIFSKTGRESEVSPAGSGLERYMEFQQASADHLCHFMREVMRCDEATIAYYAEIMLNMGNPNYPKLVTGKNETEKQHKLYINHITALAHKLDLPRVYGESQYARSMSGYNGSAQSGTGLRFIEPSEKQVEGLAKIETIALNCLKATGDKLCFSRHGIDRFAYNAPTFRQCNTHIDHCLEQCQIAYMNVLQQHTEDNRLLAKFKQAISDNNISQAIRLIVRMPVARLFKTDEEYKSVFDITMQSEFDCSKVIDALLLMAKGNNALILQALHASIRLNKHDLAVTLINQLSGVELDKRYNRRTAIILLLETSGNMQVLEALLAKGVYINQHDNYVVQTACKYRRVDAVARILDEDSYNRANLNNYGWRYRRVLNESVRTRLPLPIITTLLDHGAKVYQADILTALSSGQKAVINLLIEKATPEELSRKDPRSRSLIEQIGLTCRSYSHLFSSTHDSTDPRTPVLKTLMSKGCDLYYCSDNNNSVLSWIQKSYGCPSPACKYVVNNAPLSYLNSPVDKDGVTILMRAAIARQYDLAQLLLQRGVNVNVTTNQGASALMYAVWRGHTEVARLIMSYCPPSAFTQLYERNASALSVAIKNRKMAGIACEMIMQCPLAELNVDMIKSFLASLHDSDLRSKLFEHIRLEVGKLSPAPPETQALIELFKPAIPSSDGAQLASGLFQPPRSISQIPESGDLTRLSPRT